MTTQDKFFMLLRKLTQSRLSNWSTKKSASGCLPIAYGTCYIFLLSADISSSVTTGTAWSSIFINNVVTGWFLHLGLVKLESLERNTWFVLVFVTGGTPKSSPKTISKTEPTYCLWPVCSMRQIFDYFRKVSLSSQISLRPQQVVLVLPYLLALTLT